MAIQPLIIVLSAAAAACLLCTPAGAEAALRRSVPPVFDLTAERPDTGGAWCWYQDERAIVDEDAPGGPLLLASTVGFGPGRGTPGHGDIDLLWRNLATAETGSSR